MATQLASEEPEGEDVEIEEGQTEASEPSEEQARRIGWKPKEEYNGPPENWRDWKEFLDEDLSNAPQLKATVKLLKRRLEQADKRQKRFEKTLDEAKEFMSKTDERAYERAVKDLRAKQRSAVALGDEDAFDEAADEMDALLKDAKGGKPAKTPEIDPEVQKAFRKWERDNDWYGTDDAMTAYADRVAAKLGSYSDNDMDPDEYLDELTARVKKEFAHKFELPKKRSAVEGVGETRPTKGQETFDNLPADAKAQFARFEKLGIPVKKDVFAREAWDEIKKDSRR